MGMKKGCVFIEVAQSVCVCTFMFLHVYARLYKTCVKVSVRVPDDLMTV